jgi:hypothetical protein
VPTAATVVVAELRCSKPAWPPPETVVLIAPRASVTCKRKIHKPAIDETQTDVEEATT